MDELTYAHIGNLTKSRDPKTGFLRIKGIATDDSLDLDGQRCDPEWLQGAMSEWFKVGNLREMHQMSAIGKADKLTQKGTGFEIEGLIIDPLAAEKFENGVYGYLSIGIKGARIDRSDKALETTTDGWIRGGKIVEVSGCDIGSNQNAKAGPVELVKTVGGVTEKTEVLGSLADIVKSEDDQGDCETCNGTGKIKDGSTKCPDCDGTGKAPDRDGQDSDGKSTDGDLNKAPMSAADQNDLPDTAFAYVEPGGEKDSEGKTTPRSKRHFPINDAPHVRNALARAPQSPFGTKAMPKIKAAAKKFGVTVSKGVDLVFSEENLVKAASDDGWKHDPAVLAEVRDGLIQLATQELAEFSCGDDERDDIYQLIGALCTLMTWWQDEADEGEVPEPFTGDQMDFMALGVSPDTIKAAVADDATDEQKAAPLAELRKSLGLEEIATKAELEAQQETIKGLEAELQSVREMAAPGQPALRGSLEDQSKAAQADELTIKAQHYRATARAATNPETARQYADAADALERELRVLRPT